MVNKFISKDTKFVRYSFVVAVNESESLNDSEEFERSLKKPAMEIYGLVGYHFSHDPVVFYKEEVSYSEFAKANGYQEPSEDEQEI